MRVEIEDVQARLAELVAAVERGERVTVSRNGEPLMDWVPPEAPTPFPFGFLGPPPAGTGDTEYMVGPTDDDMLDEMGV